MRITQLVQGDRRELVVHNDEQEEIMSTLGRLIDDCHRAKVEARIDGEVNESLYSAFKNVGWEELECVTTERFITQYGALGWRCYMGGPDKRNTRLLAVLRDKLLGMGWKDVEVISAP